jgi:metal-responsive CopG/Arc/MetJ family transcriptional regulator
MNLTLSVDERLVKEAREVASSMGKSLNQLIREYLEELTAQYDTQHDIEEMKRLSTTGRGRSRGWRFNREEIHQRA